MHLAIVTPYQFHQFDNFHLLIFAYNTNTLTLMHTCRPGGLQLGHLLLQAGRDYVTFDRAASAGSFFEKYPVHRKLISLNKRFSGRGEADFNLRHDWNSLLDNEAVAPMTARTKARWPPADVLVQYLRDFAAPQEAGRRIRYNTSVVAIERAADVAQPGSPTRSPTHPHFHAGFAVTTEHAGKTSKTSCGVVVMASGIDVPNVPGDVHGIELATGYEELPQSGEQFEEKTVAVFGYGNAAFETVDSISPFANYVHMFGGRHNSERFAKDKHQFVSWESRYVGDLRALNAGTLDAYTLKSLDGIGLGELNGLRMVKCGPNGTKVCFFLKGEPAMWSGNPNEPAKKVETITLGAFSHKHDPWARAFAEKLGSARVNVEADRAKAGKGRSSGDIHCQIAGATGEDGKPAMVNGELRADVETLTVVAAAVEVPELVDALMHFAGRTGNNYPMVFDKVVRCLGWRHDTSTYAASVAPWMQHNKKYPVMTSEYESVTVPGLYFAGQLGHGKDHKRSAGGFIHGFRYTTRALFRMLETKYQQQHWPNRSVYSGVNVWDGGIGVGGIGCNAGDLLIQAPDGCTAPREMKTPFEQLLNRLFARIDTASGPYQMVAILGDGIVFRCPHADADSGNATIVAEYMEEIPLDRFNEKYTQLPRLWWGFGYQKQRKALWPLWTYFQVQLWYHSGDCAAPDSDPVQPSVFGGHADGRYHPGATASKPPVQPSKKELVQLLEDVHTRWGQPSKRLRVGRWLHQKVVHLQAGHVDPDEAETHWLNPTRQRGAKGGEGQGPADPADYGAEGGAAAEEDVNGPDISMHWGRKVADVKDWGGAHVDLNFFNRQGKTVQLWNNPSTQTNKALSQFEPGPIIKPGEGKRIVSHEYERWEARNPDGSLAGQWWIDRANGLVQDIAI